MHYQYVIVGGGAGGLELAAQLGRKFGKRRGRDTVLLIDRSSYHIWKPTLHEVAVGTLDPQQEGLSYSVLARLNHFSFMLGELSAMAPADKQLSLSAVHSEEDHQHILIPERKLTFDHCALALGSGSNFFNTPGAAEYAFVLENTQDAVVFQRHLLDLFAHAAYTTHKELKVVIIGAGATGVELSAELIEAHQEILQTLGRSQEFAIDITLIEAAPRILAGLPDKLSTQATTALQEKGIHVLTNTAAIEITQSSVITKTATLPADVVLWAAGVKAAQRNTSYGLTTNRLNQFNVDKQLRTSANDIFAIGDCAAFEWNEGQFLPPTAQAAHQQATFLTHLLWAKAHQKPFTREFEFKNRGSLVSLGDNKGVGSLMGNLTSKSFFIQGLFAKWMYMSLHLMHHKQILGIRKTALLAFARLAQRRVSGRLKLH